MFRLFIDGKDVTYYLPAGELDGISQKAETRVMWEYYFDSHTFDIHDEFIDVFNRPLSIATSVEDLYSSKAEIFYYGKRIFNGLITKISKEKITENIRITVKSNGNILANTKLFREYSGIFSEKYGVDLKQVKFKTKNTASGDSVDEILEYMLQEIINADTQDTSDHTWYNRFSVDASPDIDFVNYFNYFLDGVKSNIEFVESPLPYVWAGVSNWTRESVVKGIYYLDDKYKIAPYYRRIEEVNANDIPYLILKHNDKYKVYKIFYNSNNQIEIGEKKYEVIAKPENINIEDNVIDLLLDDGWYWSFKEYSGFSNLISKDYLYTLIKQHFLNQIASYEQSIFKDVIIGDFQKTVDGKTYSVPVVRRFYLNTNDEGEFDFEKEDIKYTYSLNNKSILALFNLSIRYELGYYPVDSDNEKIDYGNFNFWTLESNELESYTNKEGHTSVNFFCGLTKQQKDNLYYEYGVDVKAKDVIKDIAKISNRLVYITPDNVIMMRDRESYSSDNMTSISETDILEDETEYITVSDTFQIPSNILTGEGRGQYKTTLTKKLVEYFSNFLSGKFKRRTIKVLANENLNLVNSVVYSLFIDREFEGLIKEIIYNDETIEIIVEKKI